MSTMDSHGSDGRLQWSGCSDRGWFSAYNEDSFAGLRFPRKEVERFGQGGQALSSKRTCTCRRSR